MMRVRMPVYKGTVLTNLHLEVLLRLIGAVLQR